MESVRHAVKRPRFWGGLAIGGLASVGAVVLVGAVATLGIARYVVTPPRRKAQALRIVGFDHEARTITLASHPDAEVPGRYGLWFGGDMGYARIGAIVDRTATTVCREVEVIDELIPTAGMRARLTGWYYRHPDEVSESSQEVSIDTELGPAPAWLIRGGDGTAPSRWVIQVHGRGVDRGETLRAVPVFAAAGFTSLLVSYRNDGQAPRSKDGLYSLGDVEWRDVDAAITFALDNGADEVVLMGWSMGGATVLQAATRSQHSHRISGVILDSPVVDWVTALNHQAGALRIPRVVSAGVLKVLSRPWGRMVIGQNRSIDLRRLDFVNRAVELRLPILLLHSSGDVYVPDTASRALAAARPDIVTFPSITTAGHARIWNYDAALWNDHIRGWLERVVIANGDLR